MTRLLRHLLAVAALPFVVIVVVPVWLLRSSGQMPHAGPPAAVRLAQAGGVMLVGIGALLFAGSLRRVVTEGEGTLAPWDPPRRLVVSGLYRYVRNPMISGVIFIVAGQALALWSRPIGEWALVILFVNAIYIPLSEEPMLAQRFGEPYREYCRHVRRFLPRLTPWTPDQNPDSRT